MIFRYAVSGRIVFPRETPVETSVNQPVSALQCPIMNAPARTSPPCSPAITIALPIESHQIQKYGFAALVMRPAMIGIAMPDRAGERDMVADLLPAIVRTPNAMRAIPPIPADDVRVREGDRGKSHDDQDEDDGLCDYVAERYLQAGQSSCPQGRR